MICYRQILPMARFHINLSIQSVAGDLSTGAPAIRAAVAGQSPTTNSTRTASRLTGI